MIVRSHDEIDTYWSEANEELAQIEHIPPLPLGSCYVGLGSLWVGWDLGPQQFLGTKMLISVTQKSHIGPQHEGVHILVKPRL